MLIVFAIMIAELVIARFRAGLFAAPQGAHFASTPDAISNNFSADNNFCNRHKNTSNVFWLNSGIVNIRLKKGRGFRAAAIGEQAQTKLEGRLSVLFWLTNKPFGKLRRGERDVSQVRSRQTIEGGSQELRG